MLRSLRWRLQAWHALILFAVVAGFGLVLYWTMRSARLEEIDGQLLAAARVLEGTLRHLPRHILEEGLDGVPAKQEAEDGPPDDVKPPLGKPPKGKKKDFLKPPPREHIERSLTLANNPDGAFPAGVPRPYFIIRLARGGILKADLPADFSEPPPDKDVDHVSNRPSVRQRGDLRELTVLGPERTQILVGRSIAEEQAYLHTLAWRLVLIGAGVLLAGLAGGWWLSRWAVRPIEVMSATAASISASNLSQRIDVGGADTELGKLGVILNAMFERLEAAFDQQVRFTADASHELRTPLAVILSNAELALSRPRGAEEYRALMEVCLRAGQRMKKLVEDLLLLARADAGRLELKRQRLDLKHIAQDSTTLLTTLALEKKVQLTVGGESVQVLGDGDQLGRVVLNLVTNGILYNRPGGEVVVTTSTQGSDAILSVVDTGVGMPESETPRVFERFFRVDKARSRDSGGSGLGLAICKSIVEAHGGSIALSSKLNQGTAVGVRLPRS